MVMSTVVLVFFLGYLIPLIVIATSKKVDGMEKLIWIMATLFVSWLAFIAYLIAAPVLKESTNDS